jgi:hypothetical protein
MPTEDGLPVMHLEDLPLDQVMDTLATSCGQESSPYDDDDMVNMMEEVDIEDLGLDIEEPREELEPDDEDSDEDGGDFEYDTEE